VLLGYVHESKPTTFDDADALGAEVGEEIKQILLVARIGKIPYV
jgi:hypothetical protein